MQTMKRMAVGIAFVAMLALTLVTSGGEAYAGSGKWSQDGNSQGTTAPGNTNGGGLKILGITWE